MPLKGYATQLLTHSEIVGLGPPDRCDSEAILHVRICVNSLIYAVGQVQSQVYLNDVRKIVSRTRSLKALQNPLFESGVDRL